MIDQRWVEAKQFQGAVQSNSFYWSFFLMFRLTMGNFFELTIEDKFYTYYLSTLMPGLSAGFIFVRWMSAAFVLGFGQILDFIFLMQILDFDINWKRILWIVYLQDMIFFNAFLLFWTSIIPILNIPLNFIWLAGIAFYEWRIDVAIERTIIMPNEVPPIYYDPDDGWYSEN